MDYTRRLVDSTLNRMMTVLPAIALEGAKGVGKTATATQRAADVFSLDRRGTRLSVDENPDIILKGESTTFVDEWQLVPDVWDVVRRAVDDGADPGRFLLAGSAGVPPGTRLHSGAGRIVRVTMRPMSIPERGIESPSVSLTSLLEGTHLDVEGRTSVSVADYVNEILRSGFPGIRRMGEDAQEDLLDSYIDRIIDHDVAEAGGQVRRPTSLKGWLASYGAATSTTASYSSLLQAATPGEDSKPAKQTGMNYRDLLQRLWILDPLPAWMPGYGHLVRLGQAPKHHLVDPALAARLVDANQASLIRGYGPIRHDGTFLGALFESLAVQTVRVLASLAGRVSVSHLRTQGGDHEVDLIIETADHRVLAIEAKLSSGVRPSDVAHLNWLEAQLPDHVIDKVILNTGDRAYRRKDGVAVIPLALLGV